MFIEISLTFVVALRVDAIDLYVLSVITKQAQPHRLSLACLPLSAASLPAPCRCVIPFNTVIMVPICALYIYTIYVSMLGNIDKCACEREREREVVLADKKRMAWFTIEAQTIIKIITIITKCASDGKYGIQILINNLMRLWRVSTKDYVPHSPCYIYSTYI